MATVPRPIFFRRRKSARRGDGTYLICGKFAARMLRVYLNAHYGVDITYDCILTNPALGEAAVWKIEITDPTPGSE